MPRHSEWSLPFASYYYGDWIEEGEMGRICSRYGEMRTAYKDLVGKSQKKMPLRRARRK
jgi:hypothetical protein